MKGEKAWETPVGWQLTWAFYSTLKASAERWFCVTDETGFHFIMKRKLWEWYSEIQNKNWVIKI